MSLAGWAYQIGVQSARTFRAEADVKILEGRVVVHHERTDIHVSEEWRNEVRESLRRMEMKIDNLPCKGNNRECPEEN
jgi:hypothetical protein